METAFSSCGKAEWRTYSARFLLISWLIRITVTFWCSLRTANNINDELLVNIVLWHVTFYISLVQRLIWKRFRWNFIDTFKDVCSLHTCFSADSLHLLCCITPCESSGRFFLGHPVSVCSAFWRINVFICSISTVGWFRVGQEVSQKFWTIRPSGFSVTIWPVFRDAIKRCTIFQPIVLVHAAWSAVGMILSSVCLSVCNAVLSGAQDRCRGLKVCTIVFLQDGTFYLLLRTLAAGCVV